ncbi:MULTISPECIES: carbohydrate ABC transporter permease [Salipiger]|jgi:multiple sugar transport system permease protein|uniref:Carbohydrate ABC transporter membrane protein 2, CUT1 family n=1 Tax=Salipiger thiooxidans TaxID=282683 RepID=A0A1G7BIY6_9RHOB|nr:MULTISPECIES: carbohydrate ABC transporter permease [Salipiger]EEX14928.1 binding-protein-dependent transport systems inner membrane component [Citreicella sp. SE45]MAU46376.1 carbohydrate ABC transporter permease [Salipiger sp.]MBR9837972.1 carbohydrate ABC transporter permease [Paracoccaceae bacterium]MBN8187221.1 carbohydrate ABC transporter permease [Salipiger thiooxidans]MCA0847369.1 carbohydrate ABC transporter permease [Salipiger thiooxidans]
MKVARLDGLVRHLILAGFSASIALPLLWVLRVSLTDKLTAYRLPPEIGQIGLHNFVEVLTQYDFTRWFGNSVFVAVLATAISLPAAAMMAYATARYRTGGWPLMMMVLSSQMIPPIVLVLPMFLVFTTLMPVPGIIAITIAHVAINLPFMAWIMISFFDEDTRSLEEAARCDGATRWQAFTRVTIPVAMPGIIAAGLLGFILSWNEFLYALILGNHSSQTLAVGLASLETHAGVNIAPLAAATLLALAPVLILLPFLQKYLIKGLSLGALK